MSWSWGNWSSSRDSAPAAAPEPEPSIVPEPAHPYYPLGVSIPHYEANTIPVPILLGSLGGILAGVLLASSLLALRFNPKLSRGSLAIFCWFVLCRCSTLLYLTPWLSNLADNVSHTGAWLHLFFEGQS
jgi:cholestenol Delta-isomerase